MDLQNENSISLRRSKGPPKSKDDLKYAPYIKPPDKMNTSLTHPPQITSSVKITIPPRNTQNHRSASPTTPTRTASKRSIDEVTPTMHRTRRTFTDQQGRTRASPPELNNTPPPPAQEQDMDDDDLRPATPSQSEYSLSSQQEEPTTSQQELEDYDEQMQPPMERLKDHHLSPSQEDELTPQDDGLSRLTDDLLTLLLTVEDIVTTLKQNDQLGAITKEEDIVHTLQRLSKSIPIIPNNMQIEPLMNTIGDLCQKVGSLTDALETQNNERTGLRTLQGSMHATAPKPLSQANSPNTPNSASFSRVVQTGKTPIHQQLPTQASAPSNPRLAHHPTRLVAQFLPNGVPASNRRDPSVIVAKVNTALSSAQRTRQIRVVAASYNKQGNIILSTRADQSAAELTKYEDIIKPALISVSGIQNVVLREDKKWYKIQIDGVNTGSLTIAGERSTHTGEKIHDELMICNPLYSQLTKHIVAKPRWLRTHEELQTTPRSSLVFALDNEDAARSLLNIRALAVFGRHCSLRAFQERPPVIQCRNCWKFDHSTDHCKGEGCCRICSGPHKEADHQMSDPTTCDKCAYARERGDMDTTSEGQCPHQLKCTNCVVDYDNDHEHPADSRRCPTRLAKYGTARGNERRALKDNPWSKPKPKRTTPKKKITPRAAENPTTPEASQNRFAPIQPLADTVQQAIDEYDATDPNDLQQWC